ncbi:hypothetical protein V8G54_027400, partial [Vigna mungo]
ALFSFIESYVFFGNNHQPCALASSLRPSSELSTVFSSITFLEDCSSLLKLFSTSLLFIHIFPPHLRNFIILFFFASTNFFCQKTQNCTDIYQSTRFKELSK